jgi:hypothetical protein
VASILLIKQHINHWEAGTVIRRGDKETCGTLVILKGSKIMAETTLLSLHLTILFIKRKPGDWGGLVILGDAQLTGLVE